MIILTDPFCMNLSWTVIVSRMKNYFCHVLMIISVRNDNLKEAENTLFDLQEEDLTPSPIFLYKLGSFLKSHDIEVPFEYAEFEAPIENQRYKK